MVRIKQIHEQNQGISRGLHSRAEQAERAGKSIREQDSVVAKTRPDLPDAVSAQEIAAKLSSKAKLEPVKVLEAQGVPDEARIMELLED